jgi:hypothetical protein
MLLSGRLARTTTIVEIFIAAGQSLKDGGGVVGVRAPQKRLELLKPPQICTMRKNW